MKTTLAFLLFAFSLSSFAARTECTSAAGRFIIVSDSPSNILVTLNGETVRADGAFEAGEIDIVARFSSVGEMTLFAKVGLNSADNYVFLQGKRNSVTCR